jgi:hypothetical protein
MCAIEHLGVACSASDNLHSSERGGQHSHKGAAPRRKTRKLRRKGPQGPAFYSNGIMSPSLWVRPVILSLFYINPAVFCNDCSTCQFMYKIRLYLCNLLSVFMYCCCTS